MVSPLSDENKGQDGDSAVRMRSKKAPNAFRTISEVADDLHIPQHVLRFWETKFPQVKPLKRGGGRRYYRPDDIDLLRRIADLLYTQGYTIKGVQRLLREGGGQLSDNIPPPTADERAEAEAENATLAITVPPLVSSALELVPPLTLPQRAQVAAQPDLKAEQDDLRELLREALHELETIRAMLGPVVKERSHGIALASGAGRPHDIKIKA